MKTAQIINLALRVRACAIAAPAADVDAILTAAAKMLRRLARDRRLLIVACKKGRKSLDLYSPKRVPDSAACKAIGFMADAIKAAEAP